MSKSVIYNPARERCERQPPWLRAIDPLGGWRLAADEEKLLFRFGGSLVKLYTARLAVSGASEALEAFGGAGYMEDTGIARLLRDAQVLTIWEGTTNVLSLDVIRTVARPGVAKQDEDLRQRSREAAIWELREAWKRPAADAELGADRFELVVDRPT